MDADSPPLSLTESLLQRGSAGSIFSDFDPFLGVAALIILLLLTVVFSGFDAALLALNGTAREKLSGQDDRMSQRVLRLAEDRRSVQITLFLLQTGTIFGASFFTLGLSARLAEAVDLALIPIALPVLGLVAAVFAIVGGLIPWRLAAMYAVPFSRVVALLIAALHLVLSPISNLLVRIPSTLMSRHSPGGPYPAGENLRTLADIGEAEGTLEEEERELIHSIADFSDTIVREIMVNRMDIVAIPETATLQEALDLILTSGHSRLPLYVEHLDNILGIVYAKDILPYLTSTKRPEHVDWGLIARVPIFVPYSKTLDSLLKDFQSLKMHLAIVVDEYGGTAGLATMEDVLEEIVGDIRDEHDETEEEWHEQIDADTHYFDARIDLDDLEEVLEIKLETETFDFETLGGLIFHLTGSIPSEGDEVDYGTLRMRVESVDNHRIGRVFVKIQPPAEDEAYVA